MRLRHLLLPAVLLPSLLIGCGTEEQNTTQEEEAPPALQVSGAKSALYADIFSSELPFDMLTFLRPSASLGMYVSMYLAQGVLLPSRSALEGIDAQVRLIRTDESVTDDETFALLQEYGTVLQVDIVDTLNRSLSREEALNGYIRSLEQMNERMEQKLQELETRLDSISDKRKEKRKQVRELEREIRRELKEKNYSTAGPQQEELTKLNTQLAEIETREKQTDNIADIYKDLLEVGTERLEAIVQNRQVLIAGLHVVDVPGIEDLRLVIDE